MMVNPYVYILDCQPVWISLYITEDGKNIFKDVSKNEKINII